MATRRNGLAWAILLIFLGSVLAASISFVGGYNFHGRVEEYYTSGFRGSPSFMTDLLYSYTTYLTRSYEIASGDDVGDLLASLSGIRVGVYRPWEEYELPVRSALGNIGLRTGIVDAGSDVAEVLRDYDVVIFPQGSYGVADLPQGEADRIREMIKNGVGYIGICAGTIFAVRDLGIVEAEHRPRVSRGLMKAMTLPTPLWGKYAGRVFIMQFAKGGYFDADALHGWEPLIKSSNLGVLAIRGRYGRGKLVLFTVHPEGGGITLNNQTTYFSGRDLETGGLLLQAIHMARSGDRLASAPPQDE